MHQLKLRVDIVMLGVRDIERAVAFYAERLGLTSAGRFEEFAFFEAGGIKLCLSGGLGQARRCDGKEPVEVVFGVAGVRQAFEALRATGVEFLSEPHVVDGVNFVANFEDPDGHLLTLYGPP
jgi:methylmalonyl-CoA/ethylmalonyl-CoA epimerase